MGDCPEFVAHLLIDEFFPPFNVAILRCFNLLSPVLPRFPAFAVLLSKEDTLFFFFPFFERAA